MPQRKKPQVGLTGAPGEPPKKKKVRKLTWAQERFIEAYLRNGGNATQAYLEAHPGVTYTTAKTEGYTTLTNPYISEQIEAKRQADRDLLNFKREDALKILLGMVTSSLDDFNKLFTGIDHKKNYVGLGYKRYSLEYGKKTERFDASGGKIVTHEVKIISPGERRAALDDLWEKLGFSKESGKGNWFDGFDQLADFIRGSKKE